MGMEKIPANIPKGYQKFSKERIEKFNADQILPFLKEKGITKVIVEFDGSGDSGQIENISFQNKEGEEPVGLEEETCFNLLTEYTPWGAKPEVGYSEKSLRDFFEDAVYKALEERWGGWENNDGAYGTFIFDIEKNKLCGDVNLRTVETESYEKEFPIGSKIRKKAKESLSDKEIDI